MEANQGNTRKRNTRKRNTRRRVLKACDRCQLRKAKCDGASPCSRCKAGNAICVFGERKKSQDKVYPKGYVEMLEQQLAKLTAGLHELYNRLQNGQVWLGQPLREAQGDRPLTHDILEQLGLLHPTTENGTHYEGFEEDRSRMQQRLERGNPDSDRGHAWTSSSYGGTPTIKSIPFVDPFTRNNAPPTPPITSPFPLQSQSVPPVKQEAPTVSPTFMNTGAIAPSAPMMMGEPLDFSKPMYGFDNFGNFDQTAMTVDPIVVNSHPMMPNWNNANDQDFYT